MPSEPPKSEATSVVQLERVTPQHPSTPDMHCRVPLCHPAVGYFYNSKDHIIGSEVLSVLRCTIVLCPTKEIQYRQLYFEGIIKNKEHPSLKDIKG